MYIIQLQSISESVCTAPTSTGHGQAGLQRCECTACSVTEPHSRDWSLSRSNLVPFQATAARLATTLPGTAVQATQPPCPVPLCRPQRTADERVRVRVKLQALVYDILPSTTAIFSYAIGSRKLSANEQFFWWCSNSSMFVANDSDYIRRLFYN